MRIERKKKQIQTLVVNKRINSIYPFVHNNLFIKYVKEVEMLQNDSALQSPIKRIISFD